MGLILMESENLQYLVGRLVDTTEDPPVRDYRSSTIRAVLTDLTDQLRAQLKPVVLQPGPGSVVEASIKWSYKTRLEFTRNHSTDGKPWVTQGRSAGSAWDTLIDPVILHDGPTSRQLPH